MDKQKGNMYSFIDYTWNPLGGQCPHRCSYCSTKKFLRSPIISEKYSGDIRIIKSELINLKSNKKIFVCSQNDLFASSVPHQIIIDILLHCRKYPENTYLFQSKNPYRFLYYEFPDNSILCTTIESNRNVDNYNVPTMIKRAVAIRDLFEYPYYKTMITIEPIMEFDLKEMVELIDIARPDIIHIGAVTGNNKIQEPSAEKICKLIEILSGYNLQLILKDNLKRLVKNNKI